MSILTKDRSEQTTDGSRWTPEDKPNPPNCDLHHVLGNQNIRIAHPKGGKTTTAGTHTTKSTRPVQG